MIQSQLDALQLTNLLFLFIWVMLAIILVILLDGRNLQSGTKVIRLPPDAVVTERVPSDRLSRVTISAYDRYRWLYHLP